MKSIAPAAMAAIEAGEALVTGAIEITPRSSSVTPLDYFTGETTGNVTDSAGTFIDLVDLGVVDLAAGSDYVCFYSTDVNLSSTSGLTETRILVDGVTIYSTAIKADLRSTADYLSHAGMFVIQNPGASRSATIKLQARRVTAGTATFRNSRVSGIVLGPDDAFAEELALQTWAHPTNKTPQLAATLSFSAPDSSDYLILASFLPNITAVGGCTEVVTISDGSDATSEIALSRGTSDGSLNPTVLMWPQSGLSGAQDFFLYARQSGVGATTIGISEIRMVAIRLDRFASVHQTRLTGGDNSGADTTFTSGLSQTFTPAANNHLTLASWLQSNDTVNQVSYVRYSDGGTVIDEINGQDYSGSEDGHIQGFSHCIAEYAATSRTQALQRKTGGAGNAHLKRDAQIITIELATSDAEDTGPVRIWGGYGNLDIDGDTYLGIGDRGLVQQTANAVGGSAQGLKLTLSSIEPNLLPLLDGDALKGADVTVRRLIFGSDGKAPPLDASVFDRGRVDAVLTTETIGGSATVEIDIESAARGLGHSGARQRSDSDQRLINSNDGYFRNAAYAAEKKLYWGGRKASRAGAVLTIGQSGSGGND